MSEEPTFFDAPKQALRLYVERGYHVEPNLWSREECEALIKAGERLPSAQQGTWRPVLQPHRRDEIFLRALRNPAVAAIIGRLLGGAISGIQTQYFYGRPGTPGFTVHQDNFFVQAPQDAFASAWSALEDVGIENGALRIYPGSHREALLPVEEVDQPDNYGQDPNANARQAILPENYRPLELELSRGSVVFLHGHLAHSSLDNRTSDRTRNALLCTYIRRGVPFRPGRDAKRAELEVNA